MSGAPTKLLGAALAAMLAPLPAAAQEGKPTQEELQAASQTLSLIVSALNSKEVPQETKNGLFGCLYANPLGKVSAQAAALLAKSKGLDPKNPTQRLVVIAGVCGAPIPKPEGSGAEDKAVKPEEQGR